MSDASSTAANQPMSARGAPRDATLTILLAVDGGPHSARAAHEVVKLAGMSAVDPEVIVLHVDPPMVTRAMSVLGDEVAASLHAEASEQAIKPAREILQGAGLAIREITRVDEVAQTIIAVAREHGCDLLVMGSHGRSTLKSMFVGSVTAKVLSESDVPVLVVR